MEANNIMVSVICTAYNHEKYIRDALEGFVMQKTNFKYEVIIHDDASLDKTADIITEYAEKYPDIIVPIIQKENQYSKKIPIINIFVAPKIRGKYIAICEGDDYWTDVNKLQRQFDFLEANDEYVACAHNTTFHYSDGSKKDELMIANTQEHDILFEDVIWGMRNAYHTSSIMYRKEYLTPLPEFYNVALKYRFGDLPRAIWFTMLGKVRFLPYNMSTYRYMSSDTSWTSKNEATSSGLIRHREGVIAMMEALKAEVSEERQLLVDQVILEQRFYKYELLGEFDKLNAPEFKSFKRNLPFIYKIKLFLKTNCSWLFKLLKNFKNALK